MSKNAMRDFVRGYPPALALFAVWGREDTPYFAAVGTFIAQYAKAEAAAHSLARSLSGLPEWKARVVFGGMRLPDVLSRIRAMMEHDNIIGADREEIKACFEQLKIIGFERHKLVHDSVDYRESGIHVNNWETARTPASVEFQEFDLLDLGNMKSDCLTVALRLYYVASPDARKEYSQDLLDKLHQPWLYKPSPRDGHKKKRGRKSQRSRLPRQPSSPG